MICDMLQMASLSKEEIVREMLHLEGSIKKKIGLSVFLKTVRGQTLEQPQGNGGRGFVMETVSALEQPQGSPPWSHD